MVGKPAAAARAAVSISLAPGTGEAGLAAMLADLIRSNLAEKPGKRADFERLNADISIEARDAEVTITLAFRKATLVVHAGLLGKPDIRISADSATVLELSALKIAGGIPLLLNAGGRRMIAKLISGEVKIMGLLRHPVSLLRMTRLMSVNG
jgi:hypothetical protein